MDSIFPMRLATGVLCFATILSAACAPNAPTPSTATAADLEFCLSETNRYRAMANRTAVEPSTQLDEYTAAAAQYDGIRHIAHAYSDAIHPPAGFVRVENEIPWWPVATYGTVRTVLRQGIAAMWAQGPSGGHYQNLTHASVTQLGCGSMLGTAR
jgi:hypothetical protein